MSGGAPRAAERPKLSVVGLGKLGACMAASMAWRGFDVVGVDVNAEFVERMNAQEAPVLEPRLAELLADAKTPVRATTDFPAAIAESDITFVVVPTPSEEHGGFSLRHVLAAAADIGRAIASKDAYHLVVLTSTVVPGACDTALVPALEEASGKRCGPDFGVCYSPEFIALGTVIRDFLNPDFVLIGESDPAAGDLLEQTRTAICENDPPVARMAIVNAELTKLAVNTYVTTKISFGNMLATLCERLPGGDVDVVTDALGLDSRIGRKALKGGLGYGGPCFPRDNRALAYLAQQLGETAGLAEATDALNRLRADEVLERVREHVPAGGTVSVLGLSYKPFSSVLEDSQPLYIADRLTETADVVVYDPVALDNARRVLGDRVSYAATVEEALAAADVVLVANPDPAYAGVGPSDFADRARPVVVVDCWRFLADALADAANVEYVPLGIGREPSRTRAVETSERA